LVVVTQSELAALMGAARVAPAQTSPLAELQPAKADRSVVQSLASKGAVSSGGAIAREWQALMATLADPMIQANLHVEGAGAVQYFGGAGGIVGFMRREAEFGIDAGLSVDAILGDANFVLSWRAIPDAPALRVDLTVEELTVLAALADAHREEELLACIERRDPRVGAVTADGAGRVVAAGIERVDYRWVVSILAKFSAPGCEPKPEHLDPGGVSLISRKLAEPGEDALAPVKDLRTVCQGLAGAGPFMAMSVHAPWDNGDAKVFVRGVEHFWSIEYGASPSARVRVSRLGARAMDTVLRQYLQPFAQYSAAPPAPEPEPERPVVVRARPPVKEEEEPELPRVAAPPRAAAPAAAPPPRATATAPAPPPPKAAAASEPRVCPKCSRANKPAARFCTKCGTPLA
jgi:hypothetical protein